MIHVCICVCFVIVSHVRLSQTHFDSDGYLLLITAVIFLVMKHLVYNLKQALCIHYCNRFFWSAGGGFIGCFHDSVSEEFWSGIDRQRLVIRSTSLDKLHEYVVQT